MKFINRIIILVIFFLVIPIKSLLFSGESFNEMIKNNKELISGSYGGMEYWFTVLPGEMGPYSESGVVSIYVISNSKTEVTVEVPVKGHFQKKKANPYEVCVFEMSANIACPWTKKFNESSPAEAVYKGAGIHVFADAAILVFVEYSANGINESFLALPPSSLGKEYFVSSYGSSSDGSSVLPCMTACVSPHDGNVVKFTLGGNVITKTTGGMKPGESDTEVLQRGDVWIFAADEKDFDLTGSKWMCSKPVAVTSGNYSTLIPIGNSSRNYISEMELPTYTWGKNYPVPIIPGKKSPPIVKIIAKEKNTKVYRNNLEISKLSDAGGSLGKGWLELRLLTLGQEPAPTIISGDKPIGVTMYSTGSEEDDETVQKIEPFSCVITPAENYFNNTIISTLRIGEFKATHFINFIYKATDGSSIDKFEINRPQNGPNVWEKFVDVYPGAGTKLPVQIEGFDYYVKNIQLADTGVYRIAASSPFTVYSYGYSETGRPYAHPAAAGLYDMEKPDTVAPALDFKFCNCCGKTLNAKVRDLPEDAAIRSNMALMVMDVDSSYNFVLHSEEIIPGQTQEVDWELSVLDMKKDGRAMITFIDRRGNDTTIDIRYYAAKLAVEPEIIDFGYIMKGIESARKIAFKNESAKNPLDIKTIGLRFKDRNFSIDIPILPVKLMPMEQIEIGVKFNSDKNGLFYDTLLVSDSCQVERRITLKAGVVSALIQAEDADFGNILVGEKPSKTVKVYNAGNDELKITGYKGNYTSCFIHNIGIVNQDNPILIYPGGEPYQFSISFLPTKAGHFRDSIIFECNSVLLGDSVVLITGSAQPPVVVYESVKPSPVTLVPNPADEFLNLYINSEMSEEVSISVYSLPGFIILPDTRYRLETGENNIRLDLSNFTAGSYYLSICKGDMLERVKFCVVK